MGRVSTRQNKNIYQRTREELGLTRERAEELLESVRQEIAMECDEIREKRGQRIMAAKSGVFKFRFDSSASLQVNDKTEKPLKFL